MYGASSDNIDSSYLWNGEELGRLIAKGGYSLVYGGGATGMMGACARGVLSERGTVIGIIPKFMNAYEDVSSECTKLIKTHTMSGRKELMEQMADAFVVCPGGIGTMDEFFQILTLAYLNQKKVPIVLFNVNGYFDSMIKFIEDGVRNSFINPRAMGLYVVKNTPAEVMDAIKI